MSQVRPALGEGEAGRLIRDLLRTLRQLPDPRFMRVLAVSLVLAALLFAALMAAVAWSLASFTLFQWGWLDTLVDLLGGLAVLLIAILLFPGLATAIQGLLLERVANAVETRYYPDRPEPRVQGWLEQLLMGVRLTATVLLVNLIALPFYLGLTFVPPLNLALFYLINGFLLGREYFEIVATRRVTPNEALRLRHMLRAQVWLMGAVIAFLFSVPLLNLAAPVLGTAMMLHLFERLRTRGMPDDVSEGPDVKLRPPPRGPAKAIAGMLSLAVLLAAGNLAVSPTESGPLAYSRLSNLSGWHLAPPDPRELIGLHQLSLWQKLGSPQLVRRDGGARVWQYQTPDCVLDLYLYEDGDDFQATHVSTRARAEGRLASKWCYWALLQGEQARSSSAAIQPARPAHASR